MDLAASSALEQAIAKVITENSGLENPFFILDLDQVIVLYGIWQAALPRIRPFYALKCNPNQLIVLILATLGIGFDCASEIEIKQVLNLGVSPKNDIIFANPVKFPSHIKYAKETGVKMMTFDRVEELNKIATIYPSAKLVLRIKSPKNGSRSELSSKFGVQMSNVPELLNKVKQLGLELIGISFHVGNHATSGSSYISCIKDARKIFDMAKSYGFQLTLLDIGGGYSQVTEGGALFSRIAKAINVALEKYFPIETNGHVKIIAEPGTYFAESTFTLVANVILKSVIENTTELFISDGVYGSLRETTDDFYRTLFQPYLHMNERNVQNRSLGMTTFWGPTCDSADVIGEINAFPETTTGEWIVVPNWGAYSRSESTIGFNGMPIPDVKGYIISPKVKTMLPNLKL